MPLIAAFEELDVLDPTIAAPVTNVAEHGFEGRFEDWAGDARYFEYSTAADPIASGHTSKVPATRFGRDLYADAPTSIIPLDLSRELGIKGGAATSPGLLASFIRIRAGPAKGRGPAFTWCGRRSTVVPSSTGLATP
jgi:hypothetical protein